MPTAVKKKAPAVALKVNPAKVVPSKSAPLKAAAAKPAPVKVPIPAKAPMVDRAPVAAKSPVAAAKAPVAKAPVITKAPVPARKHEFKGGDFVVYPTHGVGRIQKVVRQAGKWRASDWNSSSSRSRRTIR